VIKLCSCKRRKQAVVTATRYGIVGEFVSAVWVVAKRIRCVAEGISVVASKRRCVAEAVLRGSDTHCGWVETLLWRKRCGGETHPCPLKLGASLSFTLRIPFTRKWTIRTTRPVL
jgi:hypothetical protein